MTKEASSITEESKRKELVKARWGILRNALLHGAQEEQQQQKHSIHRFSGYNLLTARPLDFDLSQWNSRHIEKLLTECRLCDVQNDTLEENIDQIEIAILALAACFPKGKCMRIIRTIDISNGNGNSVTKKSFSENWIESIKQRCQPSVCVWKVSEEMEEQKEMGEQQRTVTTVVTTLLVQETSTSTKYHARLYDLQLDNAKISGGTPTVNVDLLPGCHTIWTREPRETRLSLDDLISHRKNKGVDNTGNICIWDSERTLAYLLFHHFDDFFTLNLSKNDSIVCRCHDNNGDPDSGTILQQQGDGHDNQSDIRILELGTGMAGLSAVSLGFRLAMRRRKSGDETKGKNNEDESKQTKQKKNIRITLTDGNSNGVKNNSVNQYLTQLNLQMLLQEKGIYSNYFDLDVKCETLLWTTDIYDKNLKRTHPHRNQDVVLVSDCVHFQNFHAALAVTTLRCLRVGGSAIFCQPTRGPSLDNFFNLLSTATSCAGTDTTGSTALVSRTWLSHTAIDEKHHEARSQHDDVYDENLHRPKILVITKLREISENDRLRFIAHQRR